MTIDEKSKALMEWLEANQGEAPPAEVEPEVIEAIYALRPDLAPRPTVDLSMILDKIDSGPFASSKETSGADTGSLVSLAGARKRNKVWGTIGLMAAAAMVLVVVVPLRDNEAVTRAPMSIEGAPATAPGEIELEMFEEQVDSRLMEAEAALAEAPAIQALRAAPAKQGLEEQRTESAPPPPPPTQSVTDLDLSRPASRGPTQYDLERQYVEAEPEAEPEAMPVTAMDEGLGSRGSGVGGGGFASSVSDDPIGEVFEDGGETEGLLGMENDLVYGGRSEGSIGAALEMEEDLEQPSAPMGRVSAPQSAGASSGYGGGQSNRRARTQQPEARVETMSTAEAVAVSNEPAEVDSNRALILSEIESIEELILSYNFEEALVVTRLGRVAAATYPDLLKVLWIQESQALTGLGRLDEAEQARAEADKL